MRHCKGNFIGSPFQCASPTSGQRGSDTFIVLDYPDIPQLEVAILWVYSSFHFINCKFVLFKASPIQSSTHPTFPATWVTQWHLLFGHVTLFGQNGTTRLCLQRGNLKIAHFAPLCPFEVIARGTHTQLDQQIIGAYDVIKRLNP